MFGNLTEIINLLMKSCNFFKVIVPLIMWIQVMVSCLPEGEYRAQINFQPLEANDGWVIADAPGEGFNPAELQAVYDMMFSDDRFITSRSLLIVKNGKLVSESYFRDAGDREKKNSIRGITKCFTSVLMGFAWDEDIFELNNKLYNFIPGHFDGNRDKREITLDNVLTMRTGLAWDDDMDTRELFNINRYPSSMRIVLTRKLVNPAGSWFSCNYGTPQLAMGVLRESFEISCTDSLVSELFKSLDIDDFIWEKHADGLHFGGSGLHLKPRDLARFGLFCLRKGNWNGRQIVSEEWMEMSTSWLFDADIEELPMGYGYYWWTDPEYNAFFGTGAGGQYLYIVPSLDLVIVHTANPSVGFGYKGIKPSDFLMVAGKIIFALE